MKHKFLIASVLLTLVVVGIMVWPTPKSAMAVPVTYSVFAYYMDDGDQIPIADAVIRFDFSVDGLIWENSWHYADDVTNGVYSYTRQGGACYWRIEIDPLMRNKYTGVSPWEGFIGTPSVTVQDVDWQLSFPM